MGKNIPENKRKYMKEYSQRPHAKELRYKANKKIRNTPNGRWVALIHSAKRRGKSLEITKSEFLELIEDPCFYCGEFCLIRGLDRFDNEKDYTKDNIVPCCSICNLMKHKNFAEDYVYHCKKVVDYFLPE